MKKVIVLTIKSIAFSLSLFFVSCGSEPKEIEKTTFLEKRVYTAEDSVVDVYIRTKGEAHGGSYFSRTDSSCQYGIGTFYTINDTTLNKDLRVKVNFWARSNQAAPACVYAVALHDGDNIVLWNEIKMDKYIVEPNKWVNIVDSVTIPGNLINKPGLVVKTFSYNTLKNLVFDGDDLELNFLNVRKETVE
ncbi:MAG: hypothetical protein Q8M29_11150 [Bacteroidota bacterium]|nr:hypothetical protein [Bacteroidota bacterium]